MNEAEFKKETTRALRQIKVGTARAAEASAQVAEQAMTTYLVASVYGTAPGFVYERTENALRKLGMALIRQGGGDYLLSLSSGSEYAAQIELGNELPYFEQQTGQSHIPRISADELGMLLQGVAEETGEPHPEIFFKRTGINYQEPGPHVTPAVVKGMYDFMRRLKVVWETAGR